MFNSRHDMEITFTVCFFARIHILQYVTIGMRLTQTLSIKTNEEKKNDEQFTKTCKISRAIELWMVLISIQSELYTHSLGHKASWKEEIRMGKANMEEE